MVSSSAVCTLSLGRHVLWCKYHSHSYLYETQNSHRLLLGLDRGRFLYIYNLNASLLRHCSEAETRTVFKGIQNSAISEDHLPKMASSFQIFADPCLCLFIYLVVSLLLIIGFAPPLVVP